MRKLFEIKEEVAKSAGYSSWSEFYHMIFNNQVGAAHIALIYEDVAVRYARMGLDAAAEEVDFREMTREEISEGELNGIENGMGDVYTIDKQSILKLKDQLK